jgi:hypothetical protein
MRCAVWLIKVVPSGCTSTKLVRVTNNTSRLAGLWCSMFTMFFCYSNPNTLNCLGAQSPARRMLSPVVTTLDGKDRPIADELLPACCSKLVDACAR